MAQQCNDKDIRIRPVPGEVRVLLDGELIASSTHALELNEPGAPLRHYIPRSDVSAAVLLPSANHTTCPYKGVASYHSLKAAAGDARDAVWFYPSPCPLVEPIRDYLAFWGNRVEYQFSDA